MLIILRKESQVLACSAQERLERVQNRHENHANHVPIRYNPFEVRLGRPLFSHKKNMLIRPSAGLLTEHSTSLEEVWFGLKTAGNIRCSGSYTIYR